MEYICIKKCFYNNHLFKEGENLRTSKEDVPKHFKKLAEEKEEDISIEELKVQYKLKFGKDVSANKKNDSDWIIKKLAE